MAIDLFAGLQVCDYEAAKPWYEQLLGSEPTFLAHATEAVWNWRSAASSSSSSIPRVPGGALHTVFVDDLDTLVAEISSRGIEPTSARPTPTTSARRSTATPTATRSASAAHLFTPDRNEPEPHRVAPAVIFDWPLD